MGEIIVSQEPAALARDARNTLLALRARDIYNLSLKTKAREYAMTLWYAAHILMYVKRKNKTQGKTPVCHKPRCGQACGRQVERTFL